MSASDAPPPRDLRERLLRPTLPELWTFLAVALPVLASLIAPLPTVDLAYQLRAGDDILAGRGIPSVDTWTFTAAGVAWLDQQWGAQVILAGAFNAAGWTGLAILRAALVGLVFGLVLLAVRQRQPGLGTRAAAWLALGAFIVAAPALALRPQLLALACFAGMLALLAGRHRRPRGLWLVPIATILWANLHGSFVLAPVIVALAALEDIVGRAPQAPRTVLAAVVVPVATLVTPFGLEAWRYAAGLAIDAEVRSRVSEWQPTLPTDVPGLLFWASVVGVAVLVAVLVRRGQSLPWPTAVTLLAFAALGAVTGRGIAWWPAVAAVAVAGLAVAPALAVAPGLAVAPVLAVAPALAGARGPATPSAQPVVPGRRAPAGSLLNSGLAVALIVAAAAALPAWRPIDPGTGAPTGLLSYAPPGITSALRAATTETDRVWNPQVLGSWLELAVPAPRYAFDSRIELIPSAAWADGDIVSAAAPGWEAILEAYGATVVVVDGSATGEPLAVALEGAGWTRTYGDEDGSIWSRPASPPVAARLSSRP